MPYIPTQAEQDAVLPPPPPLPQAQPQAAAPATSGSPYIPTQSEQNAAVPPSVASAGRSLLGTDGGKLGCASTACRVLTAAGIPFPMTPSAAGMEQQMAAHGFVRADPMQADVLFGQGTGPSGRHVMVNAGNGRTIEDPGGSRGNAVQYGRIPTGDPTLTGWKYVGAQGQNSPAPAPSQPSGGYIPTAQEMAAAPEDPQVRHVADTYYQMMNLVGSVQAAGGFTTPQQLSAFNSVQGHFENQARAQVAQVQDQQKQAHLTRLVDQMVGMTTAAVAKGGFTTPQQLDALDHAQDHLQNILHAENVARLAPATAGSSLGDPHDFYKEQGNSTLPNPRDFYGAASQSPVPPQPLNALQQMLGLGSTHGTIYTSGKAALQGLAQMPNQALGFMGNLVAGTYGAGADSYEQHQRGQDPGTQGVIQAENDAAAPIVGPQSMIGHGLAAAAKGPQAFGQFAHGVPHGIAQETIQNPVGQAMNVLPFLTDGLLRGVRGVTGDIAAGRELAQPTGAGSRPSLALSARAAQGASSQGAAVVTPHPTAPGANGAARAVDGTFVKPEDVAPPVQAAPVPPAVETKPAPAIPTHSYSGEEFHEGVGPVTRQILQTPPVDGGALKAGDVVVSDGMQTHVVTGVKNGKPYGSTIGQGGKVGAETASIKGGWPDTSGPNEFHVVPPEIVAQTVARDNAHSTVPPAETPHENPPTRVLNEGTANPSAVAGNQPGAVPTGVDASVSPVAAPGAEPGRPAAAAETTRTKPVMAGSVNLGNLDTTPEAKAALAAHTTALPSLSDADARTQARALNLTTAHLATITPGEVPTGVPAKVFGSAVRQLAVAKAEQAASAEAAHQAAPTPQTLAAATQANMDLKTAVTHQEALAQAAGQSLQGHGMQAGAFEGALAKAADHQQALAQTPKLADLTAPVAKSPKAKGFGSGNKIFTTADRDAALAGLKSLGNKVNADPLMGAGTFAQALPHLVRLGGFLLEGGARNFGDWAREMSVHAPSLTESQKQTVFVNSKSELAAGTTAKQRVTATSVFVEHYGKTMGTQGVADFVNALPPTVLDKVLSGNPLAPHEKAAISDAYYQHLPAKAKSAPTAGAVKTVQAILAETRKPAMQARMKAMRAAQALARGPRKALDPLTATLNGRLGKVNAPEFVRRIQADPATQAVHGKLTTGQALTDAEARAVAGHLDDLNPHRKPAAPSDVSKVLTGIVRDAKSGKLGYDSAKAAVREELLKAVDPAKVPAVTKDLAAVKDDDFQALANVYNRHNPVGLVDKIKAAQQASLLSGPKTIGGIAAAHTIGAGFEDLAVRPLAAALSGGTVQGLNLKATGAAVKAGLHALPEGLQMIKHGPTAMQLQGIHGGLRMEETGSSRLHGEPIQNPLARAPGRVHAALYHVVGRALKERGLQEFSALKARKMGGTPEQYRGDPDVKQQASQYAAEQLYQNPNKASDMIGAAAQRGGPVGRLAVNTLMPFRNVPMNLAGRGAEYSGLGAPLAGARALGVKMTGKDLMSGKAVEAADAPAFRRGLALQAARGIVGPAAGLGAGMGLTAAGVLNAPNEKAHESGSLNIGRNKYDIARLQPVSTPLLEGGELYNALHRRPASALAPFMDNPYSQTAQQFADVRDGVSGNKAAAYKLTRVVGSLVGELSPTLLSQIASATDPSGSVRKKQAALDYLMNRVPGLRERLPAGPHPQASNYKSTGPLSLLYPGNVEPRTGRR